MPTAQLELRSSFKNAEVKRNGKLVLRVELTNRGDAPVLVNGRLGLSLPRRGGDLSLEIKDASGKAVPLSARINIGTPAASDFRMLEPGASASYELELQEYYSFSRGRHELRARYQNAYDREVEGQKAWRGELEAALVTFEIK